MSGQMTKEKLKRLNVLNREITRTKMRIKLLEGMKPLDKRRQK